MNNSYSLAYTFAIACAILSAENTKEATARLYVGFVSYLMERMEEAEE